MTKIYQIPDYFQASRSQLQTLATSMLALARKEGALEAEVAIGADTGISVDVRAGNVETVEFNRDKGVSITAYINGQKGSATTTDTTAAGITEAVKRAVDIAKSTHSDPFAKLSDKSAMARQFLDFNIYHPAHLEPEKAIDIAINMEAAGLNVSPLICQSEGSHVSTHESNHLYANTHDFFGFEKNTAHSFSVSFIAKDKTGMQRDYWYDEACDFNRLLTAEKIGVKAAERTLSRLGAKKIKTQKVPVIFEAPVAATFIRHLLGALSGGNLYRKASFLCDALGKDVLPHWCDIIENPHQPYAINSAAFDNEGVATEQRAIIEKGKVNGYILNGYAARKLNLPLTGNAGGARNVTVTPNAGSLQALLATMQKGLLVTDLMGQGVNLVTGDYSRGASGFWVENGQIQFPVEEITIAGSLPRLYQNLQAIGSDIDKRGNIFTGSILVNEMQVAGH